MWTDDEVRNVHYILAKPWKGRLPDADVNAVTHGWCVDLAGGYRPSADASRRWWNEWELLLAGWGEKPGREMVAATVNDAPLA